MQSEIEQQYQSIARSQPLSSKKSKVMLPPNILHDEYLMLIIFSYVGNGRLRLGSLCSASFGDHVSTKKKTISYPSSINIGNLKFVRTRLETKEENRRDSVVQKMIDRSERVQEAQFEKLY